jgi:hypothetical protein
MSWLLKWTDLSSGFEAGSYRFSSGFTLTSVDFSFRPVALTSILSLKFSSIVSRSNSIPNSLNSYVGWTILEKRFVR